MDELTPAQVVKWLRTQSRRFAEMADQLEITFQLDGKAPYPVRPDLAGPMSCGHDALILGRMRQLLADGTSRRPAQIAAELHESEDLIRGLIERPGSGLVRNERGWVTMRGNSQPEGD